MSTRTQAADYVVCVDNADYPASLNSTRSTGRCPTRTPAPTATCASSTKAAKTTFSPPACSSPSTRPTKSDPPFSALRPPDVRNPRAGCRRISRGACAAPLADLDTAEVAPHWWTPEHCAMEVSTSTPSPVGSAQDCALELGGFRWITAGVPRSARSGCGWPSHGEAGSDRRRVTVQRPGRGNAVPSSCAPVEVQPAARCPSRRSGDTAVQSPSRSKRKRAMAGQTARHCRDSRSSIPTRRSEKVPNPTTSESNSVLARAKSRLAMHSPHSASQPGDGVVVVGRGDRHRLRSARGAAIRFPSHRGGPGSIRGRAARRPGCLSRPWASPYRTRNRGATPPSRPARLRQAR